MYVQYYIETSLFSTDTVRACSYYIFSYYVYLLFRFAFCRWQLFDAMKKKKNLSLPTRRCSVGMKTLRVEKRSVREYVII